MSLEELQSDYNAVQAKIDAINAALTTTPELVSLLRNDVMPLVGTLVKELGEVDGTVEDLYNQTEDILQPETAGLFAALIVMGRPLIAIALEGAKQAGKADVVTQCKEWLQIAKTAEGTLEDITVPDADDEEDEDDGDEEDDEDEDDGDKKESK